MTTIPDRARLTRVLDLRVGDKIAYLTPDAINFSTITSIVEGLGAMSTDATSFLAHSEVYLLSRAAPPDEPLTVIRDVTVRVDSRGKTPARPYTATYHSWFGPGRVGRDTSTSATVTTWTISRPITCMSSSSGHL